MIHQDTITLNTSGHGAMTDLTDLVQRAVEAADVQIGVAHLFAVGSTAALGVIEFEAGLQKDLPQILDRLIPPSRNYGHEQAWHDGNGHSHLQATLLGPSLAVPITAGKLRWEPGSRSSIWNATSTPGKRSIVVTVMGD